MTQEQFKRVLKIVSDSFGISEEDILSNKKKGPIVLARHVLYRSLTHLGLTLSAAGKFLSRDHATVRHGVQVYKNLYETDEMFRAKADGIKDKIKQFAYEG